MNHILIIIAFNLILYFRTLKFTIITDDVRLYKSIQDGLFKRTPLKYILENRLYGGGTFGTDWIKKIGKFTINAVEIDHVFTIFLHTLVCVLLYMACGSSAISFWGAMLYSCNPANNQTSIWLNGRRYVLNIILVLLSLIVWQHHAWILAILLWAATSLFQVTGIFAPILWGNWGTMVFPIVFMILKRDWIMTKVCKRQSMIYSKELLIFFPRRIIVVIKTYGFYFFNMIFPTRIGMYYPTLYMWGLTRWGNDDAYSKNMDFYKGCLALILSILGAWILHGGERSMAVFGILALLQWCNIIYAVQTLADRYCNMSNVFMMYFLAMALNHIWPPLILFLIGYYAMNIQVVMRMYRDIWHFHKYHISHIPEALPNWVFFSNYFIKTQQYLFAWPLVDEGLKYHPNNFALLYQAAQCWKGFGNKGECMKYLMRAKENYYDGQEEIQGKAIKDFII